MAEAVCNFLRPPKPLVVEHDKDMAKEWKLWKQQYEYFEVATGLSSKPENIQIATFMSAIGYSAIQIYNSLPASSDEKLAHVKTKFQNYFTPKINTTFERYKFHKIFQHDGETIDEYITRLRLQSQNCNFAQLEDSLLRDQLILGIKSDALRTKLLSEDITLEKAIQISQATELAQKQTAEIHNENEKAVNIVKKNENNTFDCRNCGKTHGIRNCPAFRHICKKCKRRNHYESMCKAIVNKNKRKYRDVNACEQPEMGSTTESDTELFIGCVALTEKSNEAKYTAVLNVDGTKCNIKLDTGAQCNVLPKSIIDRIDAKIQPCSVKYLVSFGNHKLKVIGEVLIKCEIAGRESHINFKVVNDKVKPILGATDCEKLCLVQRVHELDITSDVFEGLGCLKDYIYDIDLIDSPKFEIFPARRVAFKIRDEVKKELDKMVKLGVIEPTDKPTPAVSPMVIVRKNDKIRICMDPTSLNKNIKRRHYPMNTLEEIAAQLRGAKYFTLLDCKRGFWQIPVSERTKQILTFSTPWGRYSCLRLPFGISSAPEVFQGIMQLLFQSIPNVKISIDDILIHSTSLDDLRRTTAKVIKIIEKNGLKLNKDKCKFEAKEVNFLGHVISENGMRPDPDKVSAIKRLNIPKNRKELQRVLGKFTYLSKFIKNFSKVTAPLRMLLEKSKAFYWDTAQQSAFEKLKDLISKPPVLALYDVNKEVKLQVDASSFAMGAVLLQNDHPIAYASKSLTDCQTRYSQLEKEALAVKFGCEKFHQYVWGKQLIVESDHKPLESIFKKPLHSSPIRLQKIRLSLLTYNPIVIYKPGAKMYLADPLSRDCKNAMNRENEETLEIQTILSISDKELSNLKSHVKTDTAFQIITKFIVNGWPKFKEQLPVEARQYWNCREELSVDEDGIIFKNSKVLVPLSLRQHFLTYIHKGHFSYAKCVKMARECVFWPRMSHDIFNYVQKCAACQIFQRKNIKQKIGEKEIPRHGFDIGATDLFYFNNSDYIVFIDSYSGFLKFKKLPETTTNQVILFLKEIFSIFGPPTTLETDNGPQFSSSEFKMFTTTWKFNHRTSSPYHPSGNGLAEKAVQIAKNMLRKSAYDNSDYFLGLLNYMNTPRGTLGSPSQRLFGHAIRGVLPTTQEKISNKEQITASHLLKEEREKQKSYANRSAKDDSVKYENGDTVVTRVQPNKQWTPAIIKSQVHPRSYIVEDNNGNQYRRNSINIRPTQAKINLTPDVVPEGTDVAPEEAESLKSTREPRELRRSSRVKFAPQRLQYS